MAEPAVDLFKWEDSPGLCHHCGVCQKCLAAPNCACIGEHVEPCQRFHQQLHFIRKSHDCSGCAVGVEMHRKRHRKILAAMHAVNEEDGAKSVSEPEIVAAKTFTPETLTATRKEKKKTRKFAANSIKVSVTEIVTEADYVLVSEALYGKTTWGRSSSLGNNETLGQISIERKPKAQNIVEGGRRAVKSQSTRKNLRRAGGKESCDSATGIPDPLLGVDPKIFERLGVNLAGNHKWPKKRKEDLKKLASIIAEDLEITKREEEELEERKAGFFRFVSRKAIVKLEQLHEQFSWSTGEIKK